MIDSYFFFFQAEDGIRDIGVTGVQTCALPISAGVLNILTGDSRAIGGVLTAHPAVQFVGFTGSTEAGKLLMQQPASTVKKVGLELGGNAPFILFEDADLDAAVEGAIVSKFRNMGQD